MMTRFCLTIKARQQLYDFSSVLYYLCCSSPEKNRKLLPSDRTTYYKFVQNSRPRFMGFIGRCEFSIVGSIIYDNPFITTLLNALCDSDALSSALAN